MHANIRVTASKGIRRRTLSAIFAIPIVMGILSAVGLVAALVGDNLWDWLSWATLTIPIAVIAYFMARPARAR